MIPTPDWHESAVLGTVGAPDLPGTLMELILLATRAEPQDRPQYLLVSPSLGELDNEQIDGLRRRPDFPEV